MTREKSIQATVDYFTCGEFTQTLARRVAYRTESQNADSGPVLLSYLTDEMIPALQALGFEYLIVENPVGGKGPFCWRGAWSLKPR